MLDSILDGIADIFSFVPDAITNALSNFFGKILYIIVCLLCKIVQLVYELFSVFSGMKMIEYNGEDDYLINVFFGNRSINNVYWGMALIGFVFIFAFTIIAVIRKSFDMSGKIQRSMGAILTGAAKSALCILLLSAVLSAVLNLTNKLVDRVTYLFDNAETIDKPNEKDFTDEQYATMARIYNTIGNFSLNASYSSRYNLNSCFNAIREDLLLLQNDGVFDFNYATEDKKPTWQSKLQEIVVARDPRYEIKLDDKNTVPAILEIMNILKTNNSFYPLDHIERELKSSDAPIGMDRLVFLLGTLQAANNSTYNKDAGLTDSLRGPFYYGEKDIYSLDQVSSAFNIGIDGIQYLIIALVGVFILKNLILCIFNCIARIFNMLGLYIIAPPVFSTMSLDDGGKFKQWVSASIVQTFGIFGNIIPMRLVMLFIPIVMKNDFVLIKGSVTENVLAKAILLVGAFEAASRFSGILTGILTDMAGRESASAGNMQGLAAKTFGLGAGAVGAAAGFAASTAGTLTGATTLKNKIGGAISGVKDYMNEHGGIIGSPIMAIYNKSKYGNVHGNQGGGSGGGGGGGTVAGSTGGDSGDNKKVPPNLHNKNGGTDDE